MRRRPLLWLALAVLAGLFLEPWIQPAPGPALSGSAACLLLALLPRRTQTWNERSSQQTEGVFIAALLAGALLLGLGRPALDRPGPERQGLVRVVGRVVTGSSGRSTSLAVRALAEGPGPWTEANGRVRLVFEERAPAPATDLVAMGRARPDTERGLPGAPDPVREAWRLRAPTRIRVDRWEALGTPRTAVEPAARFPNSRHAPLLAALAFGDATQVDPSLLDLFRRTGTSHLLSVSGLHIGLVAGAVGMVVGAATRLLALRLPRSRSRLWGALAGIGAALAYGQAAGWPVSAIRSAVMVVAGGLLLASERDRDGGNLLGAAALVLALVDPGALATASWQLSFGAIAGLLLVGPRLDRLLPPDLPRPVGWLGRALGASLAATAGTLPASAWHFQQLAPLSPLANLVAVPLVGTVATPAALLAALVPGPLAPLPTTVADHAIDVALVWLHACDGPLWHPAVGPIGALALLLALALRRHLPLVVLLAFVALGLRVVPRDRLVVTFLAVGDGDAILVEQPDGRRILVDGGPYATDVAAWLRRRGLTHVHDVVATHAHPDHVRGLLEVVATFRVDRLWVHPDAPGDTGDTGDLGALVAIARDRHIPIAHPGDPGLDLRTSGLPRSDDENDASLILRVTHGDRTFLFMGDAGLAAEEVLLPDLGPVDVLKVAHHGSRTATGAPFLARLTPRLAVISTGGGQGHPHPSVLGRLRGVRTLRTDQHGTIEITTDGVRLSARTWRPGVGWQALAVPDPQALGAPGSCSSRGGGPDRSSTGSPPFCLESSRNM